MMKTIKTLGELKSSGFESKSIKDELRSNLIAHLKNGKSSFKGIIGFDETVIPDLERAILSKHNILLLGLRGQAKTKIARLLVNLLDEYIPIIEGSEINDDPLNPISKFAKDKIANLGDDTPITWIHRSERYVEKLATPDVSVADLIGDVDPIKAASLKLAYSDERVIHFGLVPRANRSIFVINELPDLQARIQVSLFNILQEGDLQIRGFKIRLPLDIQFLFTANPEDYTNRGSIVTPLKDRIESQILTHYPRTIEIAKTITHQEARFSQDQRSRIYVPELAKDLLEMLAIQARESEFIDEKSGVSARMSITGFENLLSTAERRLLKTGGDKTSIRITDFWGVIPAITGKVELVYEGEQEGPYEVALHLLGKALRDLFLTHYDHPDKSGRKGNKDPYSKVRAWFSEGNQLNLLNDDPEENYIEKLNSVNGLSTIVNKFSPEAEDLNFMKELILHGLAEFDVLTKQIVDTELNFKDPLANMWDDLGEIPDN